MPETQTKNPIDVEYLDTCTKKYGLQERDVNEMLGLSKGALSHWRHGTSPNTSNTTKLAFILQLDMDDLTAAGEFIRPVFRPHMDLDEFYDFRMHVGKLLSGPISKTSWRSMFIHNYSVEWEQNWCRRNLGGIPASMGDDSLLEVGRPKQGVLDLKPVAAPPPPMAMPDGGPKALVQAVLAHATRVRKDTGVVWVIRKDGTLGAKFVTVEEL